MQPEDKDFSSVSPSARSLLMMKGYTDIPYAKETAALVEGQGPEVFGLDFEHKDFWFWARVMHFESRYKSIDQLLAQAPATNILELSSGFSFRGLALCAAWEDVYYIDTDLPGVVTTKQRMIRQLHLDKDIKGKFELLELNALDNAAFDAIMNRFPAGPVTFVNEGLLMYLNMEEKQQLCSSIRNYLLQRGGCWITADVYVRRSREMLERMPQSESEVAFMEQHNIEENKFESYEAATAFFEENGFELVQEAAPNYKELSVIPQLMKVLPPEARNSKEGPPKLQATWLLKARR